MKRAIFALWLGLASGAWGCDQPPPSTDEIVEPDEVEELEPGKPTDQDGPGEPEAPRADRNSPAQTLPGVAEGDENGE